MRLLWLLFFTTWSLKADLLDLDVVKKPAPTPEDKIDPLIQLEKPTKNKALKNDKASPPLKKKANQPGEVVKFSSKGLRLSKKDGIMFLEEDVVVTQGDMRMESNEAKVLFDKKHTSEIREVYATGNVKFFKIDPETQKKIRAEGREGIFYNLEQKIVLKGEPKLWRDDDKMIGKTISYDLKTGWAKVDKAEGIVQPGPKKDKN